MQKKLITNDDNFDYFTNYIISLASSIDGFGLYTNKNNLDIGFVDTISINGQLTNNGNIIVNKFGFPNNKIYYNNAYVIDKHRKIVKEFSTPNIHHECIYGTNTPRYYSPTFDYSKSNSNLLYIDYKTTISGLFEDEEVINNCIIEIDDNNKVVWEWSALEHFDEFKISEEEKKSIINNFYKNPIDKKTYYGINFFDLNSASVIGENKWYDNGDNRFHPENIICSSGYLKRIFVIEKNSGKIVYILKDVDDDFDQQCYAHIIPKGLSGSGNILFCNNNNILQKSFVYEVNPQTKEVECKLKLDDYSPSPNSVQKLIDGNYFIGISSSRKLQVLNSDSEIISECLTGFCFNRAILYPSNWFVNYEYNDEDIKLFQSYSKQYDYDEIEHISAKDAIIYEQYIKQLIFSQEVLTDLLLELN